MPCLHMSHICVHFHILYFLFYILFLLVSHMVTDMAYVARTYTRIPCTQPREIRASPAASLDCHVGVARGYFVNISSAQNAWRCLFDFAIADIKQSLVVLTSHLANCIQPATSASGLAPVHGDVPSCLRIHRNSTGFQVRCLARDYRPPSSPGLWLIKNILKRGQWTSGFEVTESDCIQHPNPCTKSRAKRSDFC